MKGFDGVCVDEIVVLLGVNKWMIYYYFGDKEGLFCVLFKDKVG